jgi:hypothetical protein
MRTVEDLGGIAVADSNVVAPGRKEILVVALLGVAFTTIWAIDEGKGISWDQQNYHHYNVYAWLSGRMDYHVAPAGMHSWLNPLVYVPQYWLVNHVPPVVAGAIFGGWVGLNVALVYALARLVVARCALWLSVVLALACAAVGFVDPFFLSLIGTTDADQLVSLPVLGSLYLVCWTAGAGRAEKRRLQACALAGALLGVAAGLKWTSFVFVLGMTLTLMLLWGPLRMNLRYFACFAAGGILGYLPAGGYWNWVLWTRYGNPFFPYWNDMFRSPWAVEGHFRDTRFLPQSVQQAVTYPFQWFVGLHPTSESPFRDARFALLTVLILVAVVALLRLWAARRLGDRPEGRGTMFLASPTHVWFLLTFFVVSFSLWLCMFSIQRYLTPLTLIGGLLLLLTLDFVIPQRTLKLAAFGLLAVFCIAWTQVEPDTWRVPYGSDWFGLRLPPEMNEPETLLIMLGDGPMAYVAPYLPESTRAVRLSAAILPLDEETELVRRAREAISQHSGAMRSLAMAPLQPWDFEYLKRFGLALDEQHCAQFRSDLDQFTTCPVLRQPASEPQEAARGE